MWMLYLIESTKGQSMCRMSLAQIVYRSKIQENDNKTVVYLVAGFHLRSLVSLIVY
jgi:hypothetical protein